MRINETWEDIKNSVPSKFDEEHITELVKELKDNPTKEKRDEVILAFHPMIVMRAEKWCNKNGLND